MLLLSSCAKSDRTQSIEYLSEKYSVPEEKQLVVYTSHKEEVYLPIIREFENQTGIWVEIHAGGTEEMMNEARKASESGQCDIMFGGGVESYEANKDMFMPYASSVKGDIDANYLSDGDYWTAFTELPIVFIYNKKLVTPSSVPKNWSDLFDEKWKGKIAFADLDNSGTSYTIISTMEQVMDADASNVVTKLYDQLDGNILKSSGSVIPEVSDGNCLVGITLEETALKYIDMGYNITMVYPQDGTSSVPDGCAIMNNAPHSYNAGRFIDFVVSYDTQKYIMTDFSRRPVRTDINLLAKYGDIKNIDFDIKRSAADRDKIFEVWHQVKED